jgi:mono/diheme cytochrome c family protein
MKPILAALVSVSFLAMLGGSALAADAHNGEVVAKRWCASCHIVSTDQHMGTTSVPPFSEIAKQPGISAAKVALFLLAPHPRMPDMNLTRNEAADLAAYIETQGK